MKKRNYNKKLAISITTRIIVPMFLVFDVIFVLLFKEDWGLPTAILLTTATLAAVAVGNYFVLLYLGKLMFEKRADFSEDDEAFYQGKRRLEKSNLKMLSAGRLGKVYMVSFVPKKNGLIHSCELLYYFYNYDEMVNFLTANGLLKLLSEENRNSIEFNHLSKGFRLTEDGVPVIERYACPCCGYLTYTEEPGGTYFICPVCFWEDVDNPDDADNANRVSLTEARRNFLEFYACSKKDLPHVRVPRLYEIPPSEFTRGQDENL